MVFPYGGVYVRHVGHDQAVGEANQALFFNAFEGYRISHPVPGGDASLTLVISETMLRELAPGCFLGDDANVLLRPPRLRIDARTQALMALLRHGLRQKVAEPKDRCATRGRAERWIFTSSSLLSRSVEWGAIKQSGAVEIFRNVSVRNWAQTVRVGFA
jgi:hypothetical protein